LTAYSTSTRRGITITSLVRLPPLITWSDVRWALFIVAGLMFLYAVALVIGLSATLPAPWGAVLLGVAFVGILLLIARELRAFWLRFRLWREGRRGREVPPSAG
jgi:hypothetical protein